MSQGGANPLFSSSDGESGRREPLASRMRPRSLDDFIGQEHIVGPGKLLRRAIQKDQLSSIILSGPPGTGKTTLARIIANTTRSYFIALNAVLTGVADLREAIATARNHFALYSLKTILFVDEVHRWNKSQQDALLPWVENGTIVLIGATTENPFFEVNRALVSRSRVFQLKSLNSEDLRKIADATITDEERGYGLYRVTFGEGALEHLVETADGDARSLLNALELAIETSVDSWPPEPGSEIAVSLETAEQSIQRRAVLYDKDGDYHYDSISAFIKSIRGSDPDAALYWLARMIYAGEDPAFMFRRMLISAAEDVGLADPEAISVVSACAQAFDRIGLPEGQFHLAEAALYLSTAPKSNSTLGYFDALAAVEEEAAEVPDHLKDANRDGAGFGHGEGYLYPHAYRDHWIAQQYLPDSLKKKIFYSPGSLGAEGERRINVLERREAQLALNRRDIEDADPGSPWSKEGERRRSWRARAEGQASARLAAIRSLVYDELCAGRGDRILVVDPRKGFYSLEALRRAPEGTVCAMLDSEQAAEGLKSLTSGLSELARPLIASPPFGDEGWMSKCFGFDRFDAVLLCEDSSLADAGWIGSGAFEDLFRSARRILGFSILPAISGMLSEALSEPVEGGDAGSEPSIDRDMLVRLKALETELGGGPTAVLAARAATNDPVDFPDALARAAERVFPDCRPSSRIARAGYRRAISEEEIEAWLGEGSAYGRALRQSLGGAAESKIRTALKAFAKGGNWPVLIRLTELTTARRN